LLVSEVKPFFCCHSLCLEYDQYREITTKEKQQDLRPI
jgi:hypothetical protein